MEVDNNIHDNIQNMPATSISMVILQNIYYLSVFLFYFVMNIMIDILPDWKVDLENFKLIGGAVIIVLVVFKLILEIAKLLKKK